MDDNAQSHDANFASEDGFNNAKKAYRTPVLQHHGSLTELVQIRPNRGRDGETRWIDCTSG